MIPLFPRLLLLFILVLYILTGCSAHPEPHIVSEPTVALRWSPPYLPADSPLAEAGSLPDALTLCRQFASDMSARYPEYAPALSDEDIAYYERCFSDSESDWERLTKEMAQTIINLRQQTYRQIETSRKTGKPLPDGLEEFISSYEANFREIGW